MNVLHINQSDIVGGAAIAGYSLHQNLLLQGISSHLLVGNAKTKGTRVTTMPSNLGILEKQLVRISQRAGLNSIHFLKSFNIPQHEFYQNADLLNFHNLHTANFNYLSIPALTKNKPAIFTLHDMWGFTGHCAYSYDCTRWEQGCGCCPYPESYPPIRRDNTHLEWKLKQWVYKHSNLTVVTPSSWLANQARKSILSLFPIHHIPNGIRTDIYQPLNAKHCKYLLGIHQSKKILMFASAKLGDFRKGYDLLIKSLKTLPKELKKTVLLLTIGRSEEDLSNIVDIESINLGYIESDRIKAIAYSAADIFLFPTRADNLPLVLQESMACGTPMISFDVGGVSDLVRPGITGFLAKPDDIDEFVKHIVTALGNPNLLQTLSHHCQGIALNEYSIELQTERYISLYQKEIDNFSSSRVST